MHFLFQSFFQRLAGKGGQMNPGEAVFRGKDKALGQIVAGDYLALLLRPVQKFPGPFGGGGIVQVEDADHRPVPHRHIISDGQIHISSRYSGRRRRNSPCYQSDG